MTFASLPVFNFFVFTIDDLPVYKNLTNLTKKEKNGREIHFDFRPIARYLFLLVGDAVECLKREYPHLTVKSLYAWICLYYSPDAFHFSKPIPLPKPKRKADHSALFDDWWS